MEYIILGLVVVGIYFLVKKKKSSAKGSLPKQEKDKKKQK